ncbi:MAG TPA: DUF6325 family protein [Solirubrobacteraceae bacterium]|nr:DUF6325 family protein [Solirubrobacteraceae bacterium]
MGAQENETIMGPVDIVVIGYAADAPQTGEAIPIFLDLVDRGVIRVLDVAGLRREEDGSYTAFNADVADGVVDLAHFDGAQSGLIGEEDMATAAEAMEPGSSAIMIVFENTWAAPFVAAVARNGGHVLAYERVGAEDLMAAAELLGD